MMLDINASTHDKITTLMAMPSSDAIADEFMRLGVDGNYWSENGCPVAVFLHAGNTVNRIAVSEDSISWYVNSLNEGMRDIEGVLSEFIRRFDNFEYTELHHDADTDSPLLKCFCNHCQSEGRIDTDSTCICFKRRSADCEGE